MTAWPQLQAWATPEMFINGAATLFPSYAGCKEEFTFTLKRLDPTQVYAIDIASSVSGPWFPHAFCKLRSAGEISSGTKLITFNNDYQGARWFRARRVSDGKIITKPVLPDASEIAPPNVSIAGLTDIMASSPDLTFRAGIHYQDAGGNMIPYSSLEVPLTFPAVYTRIAKKYAGRFLTQSLGSWADLSGTQSLDNAVAITGASGAVHIWTRDNTDPTDATLTHESFDGHANNAAPYRFEFPCVIKARSYAGSCKSPLVMVAIDRATYELLNTSITTRNGDNINSCDRTRQVASFGYQIRSVGGPEVWGPIYPNPLDPPGPDNIAETESAESANSCIIIYGGEATMEFNQKLALTTESADVIATPGTSNVLYTAHQTITDKGDWLGWDNVVSDTFVQLTPHGNNLSFIRPATYKAAPDVYNWFAATVTNNLTGTQIAIGDALEDVTTYTSLSGDSGPSVVWDTAGSLAVKAMMPGDTSFSDGLDITLDRNDVCWSILPRPEPAALFWNGTIADTPLPIPPVPIDHDLQLNVETWEEYAETTDADSVSVTLTGGDGFALHWVVVTYVSVDGIDDFESYPVAIYIGNSIVIDNGDGTARGAGEGFGKVWLSNEPIYNVVTGDDFEDYSVSDPFPLGLSGPVAVPGIVPGLINAWQPGSDQSILDDFEEYSTGTILGGVLTPAGGIGFTDAEWIVEG